MPAMVAKMRQRGVQFLLGYPSAISLLARHIVETGETLPLRAIFPSSEPTFRWQAEVIEKAFGCPMFNYYGQGEKVISGIGCGLSMNLHINQEMCVAELVDPPTPGEYMHLIGTPLFNYAMPLIRYEMKDLTTAVTEPCPCGRQHQRITPVETLSDHYLVAPDGSLISPSIVYLAFPSLKGLSGAQVVQEDLRTVVVNLLAGSAFTEEESRKLLKGLREILGDQFQLELRKVSQLPLSKNGKSRFVVSKVYLDRQGSPGAIA
jgi:phenylacetate-CoA ligase